MQEVTDKLTDFKTKIDKELSKFFDNELSVAHNISPYTMMFMENIKDVIIGGGKRIRGSIVYYAYKMLEQGELKETEIIKAAIYMEIFHNFLLIHDDVMDKSEIRRGQPTFHKLYSIYSQNEGLNHDHIHYGNSMAISAGDLLCGFIIEGITNLNFEDHKKLKAVKTIGRVLISAVYSEIHDIVHDNDSNFGEDFLLNNIYFKKAEYSFLCPIYLGAIFADADDTTMKILKEFAIQAGVAMQLKDDIMDLYSTSDIIGKPEGNDVKEGKKTLLFMKALELSDADDKLILNEALGKRNLNTFELTTIRAIVKKSKALDYVENLAADYVQKAHKAIDKLEYNNESQMYLRNLSEYMIKR